MFMSGMNPYLGMTFMVSTMMIALPSAMKVFNWLGTIWGGRIQFTTPMLFALSFVSMFIIGGLSGIFMAATPVDIFIHDTYFIVGHIHYVLFGGTAFGVFGGIYFWFPKMFGRMMNEFWGRSTSSCRSSSSTARSTRCTFWAPAVSRAAWPIRITTQRSAHMQPMNQFMTICALGMGASQIIFAFNFVYSIFFGPKVRTQSVARQQPGMVCPQPAGTRQLRCAADRLPRSVRVRLAGSRHRLLSANATAPRRAHTD